MAIHRLFVCLWFFFQAEDGIRYLVRSRGLGDVYKRQLPTCADVEVQVGEDRPLVLQEDPVVLGLQGGVVAVSYTHLTLPTSDLV